MVWGFVISILLLIVSSDGLSLILGWDGLGISSYLLIIFYKNYSSSSSGLVTLLSNRVGDVFILWSLGFIYFSRGWDLTLVRVTSIRLLFLIVLCSFTKRAQLPFSAWLPAAMAAPTPVSSLVHSSTLVTAGVYLRIRVSPAFECEGFRLLILAGSLTSLFSGLSAVGEFDLKRVIALSTLSQLGVIMFSLGIGLTLFCYFHLFAHALFKALLFMCSGVIIHSLGVQDMRRIGGISTILPYTSHIMVVCSFRLIGLPFLSGFFSKDLIIESSERLVILVPSGIILFSCFLTSFYSFRVVRVCLCQHFHNLNLTARDEEGDYVIPLFILYWGAVIGGYGFYRVFLAPQGVVLPWIIKCVLLTLIVAGALAPYARSSRSLTESFLLGKMIFLPTLTGSLSRPVLSIGGRIYFHGDQGWIEELGPSLVYRGSFSSSNLLGFLSGSSYKVLILSSLILLLVVCSRSLSRARHWSCHGRFISRISLRSYTLLCTENTPYFIYTTQTQGNGQNQTAQLSS